MRRYTPDEPRGGRRPSPRSSESPVPTITTQLTITFTWDDGRRVGVFRVPVPQDPELAEAAMEIAWESWQRERPWETRL